MDTQLVDLAEKLGNTLNLQGLTVTTAESCTGGLIAAAMTEIPGSSAWFDRGFVTYSNQAKVDMLGVSEKTLVHFGAVSAETAAEMAQGALANSQADWGIAVTGIAGPGGGSQDKPVGTVYIVWQNKAEFSHIEKLQLSGDRQQIRLKTVIFALKKLIEICGA